MRVLPPLSCNRTPKSPKLDSTIPAFFPYHIQSSSLQTSCTGKGESVEEARGIEQATCIRNGLLYVERKRHGLVDAAGLQAGRGCTGDACRLLQPGVGWQVSSFRSPVGLQCWQCLCFGTRFGRRSAPDSSLSHQQDQAGTASQSADVWRQAARMVRLNASRPRGLAISRSLLLAKKNNHRLNLVCLHAPQSRHFGERLARLSVSQNDVDCRNLRLSSRR